MTMRFAFENQEMQNMAMERRKWSREETVLALDLYFKIPFGKVNAHHPDVLKLARILHRPPASLSMKIGNLGRFDPTLAAQGIVGLAHGAKSEKQIWEEFSGRYDLLAEECHRIRRSCYVDEETIYPDEYIKTPVGLEGYHLSKYRINQSFFRASILSAYDGRCCVTGISDRRLLIASHIKPWSICSNGNERTDSRNGLCLSALFDRVFDCGLMTIDTEYRVVYSRVLKDAMTKEVWHQQFEPYSGYRITLPKRGVPLLEFISFHNQNVFKG